MLAINALTARYRSLSLAAKQLLLNELQPLTGYHRKSLLRRFSKGPENRRLTFAASSTRRRYGPVLAEALVSLWEASDRLCGKRLHVLLPQLVESLEHQGNLRLEQSVRVAVMTLTAARPATGTSYSAQRRRTAAIRAHH